MGKCYRLANLLAAAISLGTSATGNQHPDSVLSESLQASFQAAEDELRSITRCALDGFGRGCMSSLSNDMNYLPSQSDMSKLFARRRSREGNKSYEQPGMTWNGWWQSGKNVGLGSLFQRWLCSLDPVALDIGGLTIGKTFLNRVIVTFSTAVMAKTSQKRAIYDAGALQQWEWLPANGSAESWIFPDACDALEGLFDRRIPGVVLSMDEGDLIRQLGDHVRSSLSNAPMGISESVVWLAGQLTLHSLQSVGAQGRSEIAKLRSTLMVPEVHLQRGLSSLLPPLASSEPQTFTVAVHIRRGDSCERWTDRVGDHSRDLGHGDRTPGIDGGRPCYKTSLYVEAVKQLCNKYNGHGDVDVLLATDSRDAAKSFTRLMVTALPGTRVLGLHYNRSAVGGERTGTAKPGPGTVPPLFIEHRNSMGLVDRHKAFVNFIGEVLLLSEANAFVGTPGSIASKLIFFALVGRFGGIPPFVFLDAPVACEISGETRDDCRKDRSSWASRVFLSSSSNETAYSRAVLQKTGKHGSAGALGKKSFVMQQEELKRKAAIRASIKKKEETERRAKSEANGKQHAEKRKREKSVAVERSALMASKRDGMAAMQLAVQPSTDGDMSRA